MENGIVTGWGAVPYIDYNVDLEHSGMFSVNLLKAILNGMETSSKSTSHNRQLVV